MPEMNGSMSMIGLSRSRAGAPQLLTELDLADQQYRYASGGLNDYNPNRR